MTRVPVALPTSETVRVKLQVLTPVRWGKL